MWCLRCYAPVRHLTPRERQIPTITFLPPREELPRSRWKRGATTFGPAGRLAITAVVLLLAPWSASPIALVVLWPAYLAIAGLVLASTWRKDVVDTMPGTPVPAAPGAPLPEPVRTPIPLATIAAWVLIGAGALGALVASRLVSSRTEVLINLAVILAGLVLFVRWTLRD
jgi:hypothetical protein